MTEEFEELEDGLKEKVNEVLKLLEDKDEITISMIQRSLSWGYPLSAKIINILVDKCKIKKIENSYKYRKVSPQEIVSTHNKQLDNYLNMLQKIFFVKGDKDGGKKLILNILKDLLINNQNCCIIGKDNSNLHNNLIKIFNEEMPNYSLEDCERKLLESNLISISNYNNSRLNNLDLLFPIINSGVEYIFIDDVDLTNENDVNNLYIILKDLSYQQVKIFILLKNNRKISIEIYDEINEKTISIEKISDKEYCILQPFGKWDKFFFNIKEDCENLIGEYYTSKKEEKYE